LNRALSPIGDPQKVEVKNPSGKLWPTNLQFIASTQPLRYGPAIHVNQVGYGPSFPKQAMIGHYLGSLGEMNVPRQLGFTLVDAATGAEVYRGSLTPRADVGYDYDPVPYQNVLQAISATSPRRAKLPTARKATCLILASCPPARPRPRW